MAVDLAAFPAKIDDQTAIEEAASAGLQSMEHLIRLLSKQQHSETPNNNLNCSGLTDFTVSKFKRLISLLNRTGHARFRRGPSDSPNPVLNSLDQPLKTHFPKANFSPVSKFPDSRDSTTTSSFVSTITGDGSVSNGKVDLSVFATPPVNCGKPPLAVKRKCDDGSGFGCKVPSKLCHCAKRRKSGVKKTVRVPAISSKIADIPSDEYSWRKYGQKPIKGSPYPRGYYRCSTVKGCPARKKVERARDDPTMLLVTYDGDHRHPHPTVTDASVGVVSQKS
ncbi:probable WRKY transcription factor 11 [Benincasa hispida]|uniref:probable WRKY transcription factor 11 n=1 Tax=Benincasa hispida TaxID=102211 RepID=UPI001901198C|nr:probable WRKY transcription factor 11 [Benincasa hispida]